ncbi:uncharacterized protein G2W53_044325 [Senna tora]|uniref:Uncharacterized protein n=1 Tax=Senna tora TaxID=362788 RepID=A0A834SX79_9FABA|nr:uncharacterized protein G2W53_044325 [Senna tora]
MEKILNLRSNEGETKITKRMSNFEDERSVYHREKRIEERRKGLGE